MSEGTYQNILVAVDFSDDCTALFNRVRQLTETARITLVHVVEYVPLDLSNDLMLAQPVDVDQQMIDDAKQQLADCAAKHGMESATQLTEIGSTKTEILRVAEEQKADLLVVGSHTRHGLALLLGSTAKAVLNGAPCDVLAVRVSE